MNEQLQNAATEATIDKADAWEKLTAAVIKWVRETSPETARALALKMEQRCREKLDQFEAYGITVAGALATRAECDEAQASAAMWEREARRLGLEMGAEIERLKAAIKRQKGALKMFKAANKRVAMARAPVELKEAANAARRNEAGVQEANAVLTDEVERLTERNAGLAAALRETKKLGTHRIAAGDDYACDVADIADEALEKFTREKP